MEIINTNKAVTDRIKVTLFLVYENGQNLEVIGELKNDQELADVHESIRVAIESQFERVLKLPGFNPDPNAEVTFFPTLVATKQLRACTFEVETFKKGAEY